MTASHTNTVFLLVSNFCWLAGCHWLKFIVFQLQVCQIIIINCFSSKFLPLTTVRFGHNFTKVNIKLSTNQTEIQLFHQSFILLFQFSSKNIIGVLSRQYEVVCNIPLFGATLHYFWHQFWPLPLMGTLFVIHFK